MNELLRRMIRFIGIVFPILYFFVDRRVELAVVGVLAVFFVVIEILRSAMPKFNHAVINSLQSILKEDEKKNVSGFTYFIVGSFAAVALFSREVAILVMLFALLGDLAATIVGSRFGKNKVMKKWDKSWEGTLACLFICCCIAAVAFFTGFMANRVVLVVGVFMASLIEAIPTGVDDNLTMPIFTGIAMVLAAGL